MFYNLCQVKNKDIRRTTYIALKFTINRFRIMLCFYYTFWTGKFQIGLNEKKKFFENLWPKYLAYIYSTSIDTEDKMCL